VFVNYRTRDVAHVAAAVYDRLVDVLDADQVFRDVRSMAPGERYPPAIRSALHRADVLVAIIGPDWLAADEHGTRLVDRERDWVRWEIATALERGIPIVPVLIDDTPLPDASALPEPVAGITRVQALRIRHTDQRRDIDALVAALFALAPALTLGHVLARPPALPDDPVPSMLLRAEHGVVPFVGRDADLGGLAEWARSPGRLSAYLITGPAGQGKTRLADSFAGRLRPDGWVTGVLSERADPGRLADVARLGQPLLLVVDYAEGRAKQLAALAAAVVARGAATAPVRLLLVGRSAGDWLAEVRRAADDVVSALFLAVHHHRLGSLVPSPGDRHAEFARSLESFGAYLGLDTGEVVAPADLEDRRFDRVLDVHAAALAGLLDQTDDGARFDSADPIERVLHHESRYWRRAADGIGMDSATRGLLPAVVTFATVFGAATRSAAADLLRPLAPDRGRSDQLLAWAATLYPGPAALNPLRPDRLGEDLAAVTLIEDPSLMADAAPVVAGDQVTQALTVLGRAMPRHAGLAAPVGGLIDADPDRRVPVAMTVATQIEDPAPLVDVIAAGMSAASDALVELAADHLPDAGEALGDFGVATLERALRVHRRLGTTDPRVPAQLSLRLATRLRGRNRPEDALGPAADAVTGYRALAAKNPDAYTPFEAQALNGQALTLRALGSYQPALDTIELALDRYRSLAADSEVAFRKDLADAMDTRAVCLQELGRGAEALAAATATLAVREQLAEARPELYRPGYAAALNNAALRNREAGRRPAAVEYARQASDLYRDLADGRPDAFRQDLAVALSTLALTESDLGDHDAALVAIEECVANFEQLATRNRQAHLPNLATVTAMKAIRLGNVQRHDDALRMAADAVALNRELAAARPAVFQSHLAMALNSLANRQAKLGLLDAAQDSAAEAVHLCERPPDGGEVHLSDLATALNTHGMVRFQLGRLGDAAVTLARCVRVRRTLADRTPAAYLPDLAGSVRNLGRATAATGDVAVARELFAEAESILLRLAGELPRLFVPTLLDLLVERAGLRGDVADAVAALVRAEALADGEAPAAVGRRLDELRRSDPDAVAAALRDLRGR